MRTLTSSPIALFKTKTKEAAPPKEAPKKTGWFSPKPKQTPAQKPGKTTGSSSKAAEYR